MYGTIPAQKGFNFNKKCRRDPEKLFGNKNNKMVAIPVMLVHRLRKRNWSWGQVSTTNLRLRRDHVIFFIVLKTEEEGGVVDLTPKCFNALIPKRKFS